MARREVHQTDGVEWLRQARLGPDHAIVTSLPDLSGLAALTFTEWRAWFIDTAALVCDRIAPDAVAIFYQTDIKHEGRWIDKGHLVHLGADRSNAHCVWHKVVCRKPPGGVTFGRPAFGHWMAFSRELRLEPRVSTADVVPELGTMTWSRATPMTVAVGSCVFVRKHTACRTVVDPFCGVGTILACANDHGLDAIGIELSTRRARKARKLTFPL